CTVVGPGKADFLDQLCGATLDSRRGDCNGAPPRQGGFQSDSIRFRESNKEHPRSRKLALSQPRSFRLLFEVDLEPEGATQAHRAFETDLSAHQPDKLLGDSRAQACAAEASRGGLVGLRKAFENLRLSFWSDADARVPDGEL